MTACRSCLAPLIWGISTKGHRMPLDKDPNPEGNIEIDDDSFIVVLTAEAKAQPATRPRYTSHFATCPNAAKHRKRGT